MGRILDVKSYDVEDFCAEFDDDIRTQRKEDKKYIQSKRRNVLRKKYQKRNKGE